MVGGQNFTFAVLDAAATNVARQLQEQGAREGDHVALLLANGDEFAIVVHAAARCGVAVVPLNTRLTVPELAYQLEDSDSRFLLYDEPNRDTAQQLAHAVGTIRLICANDLTKPLVPPAAPASGLLDLSATHAIVYTSGTTGRPKGVRLTFGNHWWNAIGSALNLGIGQQDRMLVCLPLYHVGGLSVLFRGVIYGATVVVHESFDPAAVNRAIDDDGITSVSVVAVMLQRMLEERGQRPYPSSLRSVLVGGGPVPEALLRDAIALGVPVLQTYGLTESGSQAVTLSPEDAVRKLGSAGKPLLPVQIRVVASDRDALPGEVGEIWLRGPSISPGYLHEPLPADGWVRTGDLGWLDDDGYLYVSDRRDDLIISGGENVYPAEVEAVLLAHPAVAEAGVVGIPHAEWGAVPVAFVKLATGEAASETELLAMCRDRLAKYKVPIRIHFVDALPRTSSGKLMRRMLRDGSAQSQTTTGPRDAAIKVVEG